MSSRVDKFRLFQESKQDSQYLISLGIDNQEEIYNIAKKCKTPEELKKQMLTIKSKFNDKDKIDFNSINWKEVFMSTVGGD